MVLDQQANSVDQEVQVKRIDQEGTRIVQEGTLQSNFRLFGRLFTAAWTDHEQWGTQHTPPFLTLLALTHSQHSTSWREPQKKTNTTASYGIMDRTVVTVQ